jgi:hypothetical protein
LYLSWFCRNIEFTDGLLAYRTQRFLVVFFVTGKMETVVATAFDIVDKIAVF